MWSLKANMEKDQGKSRKPAEKCIKNYTLNGERLKLKEYP